MSQKQTCRCVDLAVLSPHDRHRTTGPVCRASSRNLRCCRFNKESAQLDNGANCQRLRFGKAPKPSPRIIRTYPFVYRVSAPGTKQKWASALHMYAFGANAAVWPTRRRHWLHVNPHAGPSIEAKPISRIVTERTRQSKSDIVQVTRERGVPHARRYRKPLRGGRLHSAVYDPDVEGANG